MNPPIFKSDDSYESWKNEVSVWQLMTTLEKKKQALAITLSLTGQAKAKALEIDVTKLNSETGVDELLKALDELSRAKAEPSNSHLADFEKTEEKEICFY